MNARSAAEWHQQLSRRDVRPAEILSYYAKRIDQLEPQLHTLLQRFDPPVQQVDSDWSIPIALKDNICVKNQLTTCGSKILANFIPPYHATVTEKLLAAGVPIVAKANLDEFAMGSSTENSAFGVTRNPWDPERVPGGSSGGSAALVAADMLPWSLGSDTGGSIRQPAALCGVVGMKPTYGLVSRYGLVAYASSLDQIGPLTRTVEDNALLLQLIAGHDPLDSTSADTPVGNICAGLGQNIKGLRLAVPKEMMGDGIDPDVRQAVVRALAVYEGLGAQIEEISLPTLPYALAAYYLIATSEASSNLARYDGVSYGYRAPNSRNLKEMYEQTRSQGFGAEVKLRIMLGTFALSAGYYDAYYKKAMQARTLLIREFTAAFASYDALVAPTSPITAFKLGEKTSDPLQMYLTDILTVAANLTGIPAMSLPCGFDHSGLPIGLQLMGKPLSEARLYQLAHAYEQACDWHLRQPALSQAVV
ncbi:MAG: Asp-tRNA(Asn)/Glu-tRNA(Gln) amidotransferase GatCAB subunit A [Candidatus Melainabacteria bacterium HGW-Melainabacteria-1]|nr:MAG: Asp-tRNA(Asn)/Glu-tRNA(Gln) amidotransferase GatCAB subunit A [Candidatus Melainabacteria bacterium HGW-Melainabacteria-1]